MTETQRSGWPETPGGTTDWELVFEAPETGLIPLVLQAKSARALREATVIVIRQLHTRKDDQPEAERFVAEVSAMIPDEAPDRDLSRIAAAATEILRGIKESHKAKASEYERDAETEKERAKKSKTTPTSDRRDRRKPFSAKAGKHRRRRKAKEAESKRRNLIFGAVGFGVAALAAAVFLLARGGETGNQDPTLRLIEQMKAAATGTAVPTHAFGGPMAVKKVAGHQAVVVAGIPHNACTSAAWVFVNRGNIMINGVMPTNISPRILRHLCTRRPETATLAWFPKARK